MGYKARGGVINIGKKREERKEEGTIEKSGRNKNDRKEGEGRRKKRARGVKEYMRHFAEGGCRRHVDVQLLF